MRRKVAIGVFLFLIINSIIYTVFANVNKDDSHSDISLSTSQLSLITGERASIDINNPQRGYKYQWTSSDTRVAIVNKQTGTVTARKPGQATIICEVNNRGKVFHLESKINVSAAPTLSSSIITLSQGEISYIDVINKQPEYTYRWTSSNPAVVAVDTNNGLITAKSAGQAIITNEISFRGKTKNLRSSVIVEQTPSFFYHRLQAHGIDMNVNLYSQDGIEALKQTMDKGFEFISVDLTLASNNISIELEEMSIESSDNVTFTSYSYSNSIKQNKTLSLDETYSVKPSLELSLIANFMRTNPNLLLEIDIKNDSDNNIKLLITELINQLNNDKDLLDRLLIQVHDIETYQIVHSVYEFKYYQYYVNDKDLYDIDSLISICKRKKIASVAIHKNHLDETMIKTFRINGIRVIAHSVDDVETAKALLKLGVDTLRTNSLVNEDLYIQ